MRSDVSIGGRSRSGPFSSRLPPAIHRQERGDRRENQTDLSVLCVLCGEIQLSDGELNDPGPSDSNSQYGSSTETTTLITFAGRGYRQVLGANQFDWADLQAMPGQDQPRKQHQVGNNAVM